MEELKTKVNTYINKTLLSTDNLPDDIINQNNLAKGIVDRLFLRKFRKYAISSEVKKNVEEKINNIISNSLPLVFIPSFGGYKHWWSPSYPAIDWAEVFNMKFILKYLFPIINSYTNAPVRIEYESEEVILSELNNVPQSGLDEYTRTFKLLAAYFTRLVNNKTTIELTLARDLYDVKKLHTLINDSFAEHEERFNSYDPEDQKRRLKKVETNFLLNGVIDYTNLNEKERLELYKRSRILNETFLDMDFELRPNYFEGESSIPLLFSFGLGPGGETWLHIGSCSTSMVDFWTGIGIIEYWPEEDKCVQRIISKTQYDAIKDQLIKVDVESPISNITNNLKYIYVYQGKLVFGG